MMIENRQNCEMKNLKSCFTLNLVTLLSLLLMAIPISAAPLAFFQNVPGIITAQPAKTETKCPPDCGNASAAPVVNAGEAAKVPVTTATDGRFIIETTSWIVEDDSCDCSPFEPKAIGFNHYGLLSLGLLPLLFPVIDHIGNHEPVVVVPVPPVTASPMSLS